MNNSPFLPHPSLLSTKEEEKGLAFRHEIQILARIREMARRRSDTSFAVLSVKRRYIRGGGYYSKERNSRKGRHVWIRGARFIVTPGKKREMRIREFSSSSIERGNFLLYRYFFLFFFFLPKFLVCSSLRRLILAGKVNLYKVNEGYVIETISFFPVFLGTIQYSYNWNKQSICLFSFNYIHIVCQRLKLIYCVCCIEPIRIPRWGSKLIMFWLKVNILESSLICTIAYMYTVYVYQYVYIDHFAWLFVIRREKYKLYRISFNRVRTVFNWWYVNTKYNFEILA